MILSVPEQRLQFRERCAKLYAKGLSTYQVAASLKCTQGKVARALRALKVKRRTYTEAALARAA